MCLALIVIQVILSSFGVILCCCACCGVWLRMIISPALAHMPPPPPPGASKKVIDQLPLKKFSEELGIDPDHRRYVILLSAVVLPYLTLSSHFFETIVVRFVYQSMSRMTAFDSCLASITSMAHASTHGCRRTSLVPFAKNV